MPVNMLTVKGSQLLHAFRILLQNARHVHELGEPDHLAMVTVRDQARCCKAYSGGLKRGGRNTGGKLHSQIHDSDFGTGEKILQSDEAKHIAYLMGIANRRRNAVRKYATVELTGGNQCALAVHMAIDESRNCDTSLCVDLLRPW